MKIATANIARRPSDQRLLGMIPGPVNKHRGADYERGQKDKEKHNCNNHADCLTDRFPAAHPWMCPGRDGLLSESHSSRSLAL